MNRQPISAIVVSCDEGPLLERCLRSLAFCDELIVVDMECKDDSVAIATRCGARVVPHPRVPFIEAAQQWMATLASHDWILTIDPDEVIDGALAKQIAELVPALATDVAAVDLPWQFYFGTHALKGTYWGGRNWKLAPLFHRDRVELGAIVHRRATPKPGHRTHRIAWDDHAVMHHYWMLDYAQFIEKHQRYIRAEGVKRQAKGDRFRWRSMVWESLRAFAWSMIKKSAWRDGVTGVGLSGFYAWYVASSWLSLRQIEREGLAHE